MDFLLLIVVVAVWTLFGSNADEMQGRWVAVCMVMLILFTWSSAGLCIFSSCRVRKAQRMVVDEMKRTLDVLNEQWRSCNVQWMCYTERKMYIQYYGSFPGARFEIKYHIKVVPMLHTREAGVDLWDENQPDWNKDLLVLDQPMDYDL